MPSYDFQFNSFHFVAGHPHARELFKRSVSKIEIEVSSYCNRVCSFCPNSFLDRRGAKKFMTDELYTKILTDLASVDYAGSIRFHRYNEPLADRAYIIRRIRESTRLLPGAEAKIFTNGDYLTVDYLDELREAGVREIILTVYPGEHQEYSDELMREKVYARLSALGLPYNVFRLEPNFIAALVDYHPALKLLVRAQNFATPVMSQGGPLTLDRGGSVQTGATYQRRSPCIVVFNELQVELDGTVVPCCNIRTDNPDHQRYRIGRIGEDGDVFQVWSNAAYTEWRRRLFFFDEKTAPCASCSFAVQLETPKVAAMIKSAAVQLGLTPTA